MQREEVLLEAAVVEDAVFVEAVTVALGKGAGAGSVADERAERKAMARCECDWAGEGARGGCGRRERRRDAMVETPWSER